MVQGEGDSFAIDAAAGLESVGECVSRDESPIQAPGQRRRFQPLTQRLAPGEEEEESAHAFQLKILRTGLARAARRQRVRAQAAPQQSLPPVREYAARKDRAAIPRRQPN